MGKDMSKIVGTIATAKQFLSKQDVVLLVKPTGILGKNIQEKV